MEKNYRHVAQPQRCINLTMKEVVKKEVEKLLEERMIYPISDSTWVSPMQSKVKSNYKEISFSLTFYGSNVGKVGRKGLLLFSGQLFRL